MASRPADSPGTCRSTKKLAAFAFIASADGGPEIARYRALAQHSGQLRYPDQPGRGHDVSLGVVVDAREACPHLLQRYGVVRAIEAAAAFRSAKRCLHHSLGNNRPRNSIVKRPAPLDQLPASATQPGNELRSTDYV